MSSGAGSGFQNERTNQAQTSDDQNSNSDVKPVSIFSNDYKKHDDLKLMLDSNKDNLKLDAMKRIIGMIAKGKNASDLFPAVVKNVVSKNVEIKKLVYVYLMRYAEEQQDLALLSISTFQRALKDPNQLIRASALRVLSSIRVPIIVTIMMLAIKEAVSDMSPYVRKTAANAITKLYSLDPELKGDLVEIIEKLLADKTILVAGSAIQAFEEVCPERIDLIHKNYRKLCNLLIDVDEWGQIVILNMLTRYARTQFVDPGTASEADKKDKDENKQSKKNGENNDDENEEDEKVEENEDSENEEEDYDSKFSMYADEFGVKRVVMDPDHRLLLRVSKPLLQSRNSAVVMAVAQLYYYVAPKNEIPAVAKSLVRLLRSYREVQIIVLKNIVSMAQKNQQMFQPHQKSFYVHSNDSIQIKLLKLEILTCLANESNISVILREFQTYVLSHDKEFAAATIHAIGRCASTIKEVADNCLTGLVNLMSKKDETIVAESVVVIKRLLQSNPSKNGHIIKKMAKMTDKVTVPMARASILWLIGEYSDRVNKIAPDVLRKMTKTFCEEENVVKLQILNLACKLYTTNQKQVALLTQYVLNMAKYDQNYDIRDRARFLRTLIFNNDKCPVFAKHVKKIILAPKPAPVLQSIYKDSDQYQLGTLSHAISARVNGYSDLPEFPTEAPDPSVRNIEIPVEQTRGGERRGDSSKNRTSSKKRSEKFYSDDEDDDKSQSTEGADPTNDEDDDEDEEDDEEKSESGSDRESEEEDEDDDDDDKSDDDEESDKETKAKSTKKVSKKQESEDESSEESDEESEDEKSDDEDEEESSEDEKPAPVKKSTATVVKSESVAASKKEQSKPEPKAPTKNIPKLSESSSDSESSSESSESSSSASSESEKKKPKAKPTKPPSKPVSKEPTKSAKQPEPAKAPEMSLLDLDFSEPTGYASLTDSSLTTSLPSSLPVLSPSLAADLANLSSTNTTSFNIGQQNFTSKKEYELLSKINGNGLQVTYKYTRAQNQQSSKMVSIELVLTNVSNGDFNSLAITNKKLQSGMSMSDIDEIDLLKGASTTFKIGIDFNDTTQAAQFELSAVYSNDPSLGGSSTSRKWPNLSITCPIGELLQPGWSISENEFNKLQAKLKGMNEINGTIDDLTHAIFISKNYNTKLLENINMCQIPSSQQDSIKYAALTSSSKTPLILSLYFTSGTNKCQLNVNCEKIILANMFIKELKQLLTS